MKLKDAIARERELAEKSKKSAEHIREVMHSEIALNNAFEYEECATEHEQVAEWLEELAKRREEDKWIPVSERLPEDYTKVLITNGYGTVTRVVWNTWYQNEYKDARKEYKAIAWKPLPKPYKESEEE